MKKITIQKPTVQYGYVKVEWECEEIDPVEISRIHCDIPEINNDVSDDGLATDKQLEMLRRFIDKDLATKIVHNLGKPIPQLTKDQASALISLFMAQKESK